MPTASDQLLEELNPSVNYQDRGLSIVGIKRVSYTHDAMIDLVVNTPEISQRELAAHFGYSEPWISQIFASDAFQERLAARKNELIDPTLRLSVEERIKALLNRSLAVLEEKLHKPAMQVSDQLAIRAAEFGSRSLGLGKQDKEREAPVEDRLVTLAARMISLQRNVKDGSHEKLIEGEVLSRISDAGGSEALRFEGSRASEPE